MIRGGDSTWSREDIELEFFEGLARCWMPVGDV